jgi:hypothetical protein
VLGFRSSKVYYPHLQSIVGKRRGKQTYYHLVESAPRRRQATHRLQQYQVVDTDRFGDLTAVDTTVTALGVTRGAVITHSPALHAAQSRAWTKPWPPPTPGSPSYRRRFLE